MGDVFTEEEMPLPGRMTPDDVEGPRASGVSPEQMLDMEATEPTPEEQAQYDQAATMAFKFLHGPKSRQSVEEALNNPKMPVHQAVGRLAAKLAQMIIQSAKASQVNLAPEVMRELIATEVIPELLEIGQAAGFWNLSEAEADNEIEMAALAAAKAYGEGAQMRGELPTEESRAFLESQGVDLGQLMAGGAEERPITQGVQRANQELFVG